MKKNILLSELEKLIENHGGQKQAAQTLKEIVQYGVLFDEVFNFQELTDNLAISKKPK